MTAREIFDAAVIGTGQGGKPLAGDLAEAGMSVAVIERDRVGGTCVVRGCTPTKTMVASARVAHLARRAGDYGVRTGEVSVDMEAVRRRKREIVDDWVDGSRKGLERRDGLELIFGEARLTGARELEVDLREDGVRRIAADRIFVNTGARPLVPPVPGLEDVEFLDSTSVMELGEVPDHLLVLGGGLIGLEFGQMFRRFGADVTIVERGDRIAAREDEDVSEALEEILEEDGVRVLTGTEASAVEPAAGAPGAGGAGGSGGPGGGSGIAGDTGGRRASSASDGVRLEVEGPGGRDVLTGSHLLVAAGRRPNTDALDLEAAGLSTDDRGYLPVNGRLETAVEGIWALGDVTGHPPFTHTSYDDYRVIRANLLGGGDASVADRVLTYTVFTDPQLGRVGTTEREARDEGRDVRVAKLPMSRVARAIEMDETRGFMKAVVDADTREILGAAVLGVEGGEVAMGLKIAMMGGLPWTALRDAVLAHPTLTESLNNLFMTLD